MASTDEVIAIPAFSSEARILPCQCADIAQLAQGRVLLQAQSKAWSQANLLLQFYRLLYARFNADGVRMRNWLAQLLDSLSPAT